MNLRVLHSHTAIFLSYTESLRLSRMFIASIHQSFEKRLTTNTLFTINNDVLFTLICMSFSQALGTRHRFIKPRERIISGVTHSAAN